MLRLLGFGGFVFWAFRGCFGCCLWGLGSCRVGCVLVGLGMFGEFGGLGVIGGCGFGFGMTDGIVCFVVLDWRFGVGCLDVLWGLLLWVCSLLSV